MPSRLEVKREGRQAESTSLDHLCIYSHLVTDEDHVCQTCGGAPGGQNRDIHLTFPGLRLQRAYQVPQRDVTTGHYIMITKHRCARQLLKVTKQCRKLLVLIIRE